MNILQMSISGGVLILVITVLRALFLHKVPKQTFLLFWAVTLLRLLIPISLPSALSVYSLFTQKVEVPQPADIPAVIPSVITSVSQQAVSPTSGISIWSVVWLIGFIACAAFFAVSYVKCYREFQMSLSVENEYIHTWLGSHRLGRKLTVRQSDRITAPLTFGIAKPVILLSKKTDWSDEKALSYALTHEFTHIRRFDTAAKLLFTITLCVHWFNPLVWIMYLLANRDIELSCDEAVIRQYGYAARADYARTLIRLEEQRSGLTPLCNHFSKNSIEERISAIMKLKKATTISLILAFVLIIGTVTAFATSAQTNSHAENATESATVMSRRDGDKTYYSFDSGKTFEAMTDEEYAAQFSAYQVEWWTAEEYAAWLEQQKIDLQNCIGSSGWTSATGYFVWTQEMVDETIREYEAVLEEIKSGIRHSKTVDGGDSIALSYEPGEIASEQALELTVNLDNCEEYSFGPYATEEEIHAVVEPFCIEQVAKGNLSQSKADEILAQYLGEDTMSAAIEGGDCRQHKEELSREYAPFGMSYDSKSDCWYYQGKKIRSFLDIRCSNGKSMSGGEFSGSLTSFEQENGTVDVVSVRDMERKDANGFGTLIGLEIAN